MKPIAKITRYVLLLMLFGVVLTGWKLYQKEMYDRRWMVWENELSEAMTETDDKHILSMLSKLKNVAQPLDAMYTTRSLPLPV